MALVDTIFEAQKSKPPLTKDIAQRIITNNANLWKELGVTPNGSPVGPKRPQDNFRIVNQVFKKGLDK